MLRARVTRTLEEHRLLARGDRVLCAVSGGRDSTALLHVLVGLAPSLGVEVEAATVDHGLRPESPAECERAAAFARGLGIECSILALGLPPGPAIQERARRGRYERLARHAAERAAHAVAVGHSLDDQAETVLARLLRGAGLRGLAGVLRRREDGVIRPLLDCTRREIEAYLAHHGLAASVEDPSNDDPRHQRVRIRRSLLPGLVAESPEVARTLASLADEVLEVREHLSGLADASLPGIAGSGEGSLDAERLAALSRPLRLEILRRWALAASGAPPGRAQLEALDRLALTARGDVLLSGGVRALNQDGMLRFLPPSPDATTEPASSEAPPLAPPASGRGILSPSHEPEADLCSRPPKPTGGGTVEEA